MKSAWYNPWFSIPVLLFFNTGLVINYFVPYGNEILYFNAWRFEPLNSIFRFLTHLGEAWAYGFFALLMAVFGRYRYTVLILVTGLIILPLQYYVKDVIGTDRPLTYFEKLDRVQELVRVTGVELNSGQTSFPSGHTIGAFALYSVMAMICGQIRPRFGLLFALMGVVTALSRIFLVQHFLADVLGGTLIGLLVGELIAWFSRSPAFERATWMDGNLLHRRVRPKKETVS